MLVLPESIAISDAEGAAIRVQLTAREGLNAIVGSGFTGMFDTHGKLRAKHLVPGRFGGGVANWMWWDRRDETGVHQTDPASYLEKRTGPSDGITPIFREALADELPPTLGVPREACIRTHRYRLGSAFSR